MAKEVKNPGTMMSSVLLCLTSLNGLFMVKPRFGCVLLAQVWFLSNAVTAGLYVVVNGMAKAPPQLRKVQEQANTLCGGVSMPLMAAYFLLENELNFWALVFLVAGAATAALLFADIPVPPQTDVATIFSATAAVSTLAVTATCYFASNAAGMTAGICLVLGNVALAQAESLGVFEPLDMYLLCFAMANYFFGYAI